MQLMYRFEIISVSREENFDLIHTITADNGKEFAKHQEIAKELDISFYFCKSCAILGNVALLRTAPKRDLVISHQTRNLIYY
jgi:hypothetical protein